MTLDFIEECTMAVLDAWGEAVDRGALHMPKALSLGFAVLSVGAIVAVSFPVVAWGLWISRAESIEK